MGVWSDISFKQAVSAAEAADAWKVDEEGSTDALNMLATQYLGFDKERVEGGDTQVQDLAYLTARKLASEIISLTRGSNIPIPSIIQHHVRAAAMFMAAAGVVQPPRGSMDEDLNDIAIENIDFTKEIMRNLHLLSIMRLKQAIVQGEGATGF